MRCCSRGPLGRLLGVKTSAEMDQPVATTFMKSLLAPKARHSHQSLGQPPRVRQIESRFQRLFAWRFEFLGRCPRLDFEIAPLALQAATGFPKWLYFSPEIWIVEVRLPFCLSHRDRQNFQDRSASFRSATFAGSIAPAPDADRRPQL